MTRHHRTTTQTTQTIYMRRGAWLPIGSKRSAGRVNPGEKGAVVTLIGDNGESSRQVFVLRIYGCGGGVLFARA
ncbi:hypothetical protein [Paraburkholderia flagellata]|uniref:hypothetical protein n=1 Tax=Paraburkholderia flagellata TaxID=2883241 RepID=UPI00357178AF